VVKRIYPPKDYVVDISCEAALNAAHAHQLLDALTRAVALVDDLGVPA
jgi:hypothetical protein